MWLYAVALTKTLKKGRQIKDTLIEDIRDACDKFESMYMFKFHSTSQALTRCARRLFLGKNKVAQVALGKSEAVRTCSRARCCFTRLTAHICCGHRRRMTTKRSWWRRSCLASAVCYSRTKRKMQWLGGLLH
jgi:hypothetical protein